MASILSLALEAAWEALMEPNVMGYRMGRCTQDAIQVVVKALSKGDPVVLDADIKSFFDNVKHEAILDHVWCFQDVVKRSLTAGIVENGRLMKSPRGIMQGSPLSPILANIALHGMETELEVIPGVTVVSYADDLVVVAPKRRVVDVEVVPRLVQFLAARGLALKAEKTRIVTRQEGFDFLGFNVMKPCVKLLVRPREKNVHEFLEHVKDIIRSNKQTEQKKVIALLNPVINGWARYFQYSSAGRAFARVDVEIWRTLWRWAKRRHPDKSRYWVRSRYFGRAGNWAWAFRDKETGYALVMAGDMKRKTYSFVIGGMSVLDKACPSRKMWASQKNDEGVHNAFT